MIIKHEKCSTMMQGRLFNCMLVLDDAIGTVVQGKSSLSAEDARQKALIKANERFVPLEVQQQRLRDAEQARKDAVALSLAESQQQD